MDLTYFNDENFHASLKRFFKELNIPVSYVTEEPATAEDILENTYRPNNPAHQLMDDVWFLGMVDDAAFAGNRSLDASEIKSDYDGVLIFGITLHERDNNRLPTRSQLAEIARAFNREFFYTPVIVVYKYGRLMAFANTERLKYSQEWREGEKAGKVTMLRDIDITNPHSGHERILNDLKIPKTGKKKVDSFSKLYAYWQDVFSVNILNKKFYQELSNWYFWAVREVSFPSEPSNVDAHRKKIDIALLRQEHNAKNVIRLLTRFLFVWFVKEKKLIPEELFDIDYLKDELLKEISPVRDEGLFKEADIESIYYKAILQNLFFASLNCPVEPLEKGDNRKRGFRLKNNFGQHRDANYLMRYKNQFKNSGKFLELMNNIVPFLNGGLFECLDNKTDKIYIDGFSDNLVKPHHLIVPDYLFFGFDQEVDLSGVVGIRTKAFKKARVRGLISILESYKFTIAENTPIEEDVALDPELLGKVFENLLASYNPETKTTARKQTGSFYTPREIVSYMVDESLIAYLKNSLENWNIEDEELDKQLHDLLSFDAINPFAENDDLQKQIIDSLDNCKILDPACGSGAFPMGVLQKMVHILQKVDPENRYWQELQLNKAVKETEGTFAITDKKEREQKLIEINDAFDEKINGPDYARKLFLIEDCIYGVDIQPIATQISKLRFFISLIVDQKVEKDKPNFGIIALPNLETKFVAANTLIGIDKPKDQMTLFENQEIKGLEQRLKNVRHRLFSAKSPATKRRLRDKDKEICEKMGELLVENGWANETAKQLASWDPYDQNASSPFFDSEWMFDIKDGFDVVIGNPPYFNINTIEKDFVKYLSAQYNIIHTGHNDIVYYFIFLGVKMLTRTGCSVFITSNYFLGNEYAQKLRRYLSNHTSKIINFKEHMVFDAASVHTCISISYNEPKSNNIVFFEAICDKRIASGNIEDELNSFSINRHKLNENWLIADQTHTNIFEKLKQDSVLLGDISIIEKGSTSGKNQVFTVSCDFAKEMKLEKSVLRKNIKNGDIGRYTLHDRGNLLIYTDNKTVIESYPKIYSHLKAHKEALSSSNEVKKGLYPWYRFERPRKKQLFDTKEKIIVPYRAATNRFAYDNQQYFNDAGDIRAIVINDTGFDIKYVLAVLNSKLIDWYYGFIGKPKGKVREYFNKPLSLIPLKKISLSDQQPLINLVNIVLYGKSTSNKMNTLLYERVIDAVIFELYFSNHMKEKKIDVIQFVKQDVEEVVQNREFNQLTDDQKEKVVNQLHDRWTHPDSEVRNRIKLFAVRSPEILKPVLESK